MKKNQHARVVELCAVSVLAALIVIFDLALPKIAPLPITLDVIPVVLGAALFGYGAGAVLGFAFGFVSFLHFALGDAFANLLFTANPLLYIVMCILPRVLIGLVAAFTYRVIPKKNRALEVTSYVASAVAGTVTNTVFFVGFLVLFFFNTDAVQSNLGTTVGAVIGGLVTTNALIELAVNVVVVTVLARSVAPVLRKIQK